jgi:VAD1 Analog of StAR-related lipid transfer domain
VTSKTEVAKENKDEYITKEELEKLFDPYPIPSEGYDLCEIVLFNFPAKDFQKQFMDINSPNAYGKFLVEKGEQNVNIEDWVTP